MKWLALVLGLVSSSAFAQGVSFPPADPSYISGIASAAGAAAAPVKSVNGLTGAINVPVYQRQVSPAPLTVSTVDGTVSWNFPTPFGNMPTCWPSLAATTTTSTFDYPQQTAISTTSVSFLVTAHPKSLSIGSLALPIAVPLTPAGAPAGTTLMLSCFAPL